MYSVVCLSTGAVMDWGNDPDLIKEWAERNSVVDPASLYAVKPAGSNVFQAVYRNGERIPYQAPGTCR